MMIRNSGKIRPAWPLLPCLLLLLANTARAQDKSEHVTVDKTDRTYVVHLPAGYAANGHYPVVVLFHGRQQDAADMAGLTRFNQVADRYGIIAVYPNASAGRWNIGVQPPQEQPRQAAPPRSRGGRGGIGFPGGGPMGRRGGGSGRGTGGQSSQRQRTAQPDDLDFVNDMLDKLASAYSVDASRIYATGLSDGGFMTVKLGCSLANRFAAIAPVGAEMPKTLTCVPSRLLPVLMINGTSDPVVPYKGGSSKTDSVATLSARDSAQRWATLNNCGPKPQRTSLAPRAKGGKKTEVDTYTCQQDTKVALYSVKDGGNTWPGGQQFLPEKQVGKTSNDLDANEVIWKFLQPYRLAGSVPQS
jgi:polyhydroxybutyrate depolymerase